MSKSLAGGAGAALVKGPIAKAIASTLTEHFQPVHLEVINESYMHNVPKDAETHFKVLVVSEKFKNLPLIKCHRLVNSAVKEKLAGDFVHALSIQVKTPEQWSPGVAVDPSPKCLGGFGR